MARFRIVVEVTSTQLLAKDFEAPTMTDAVQKAEASPWWSEMNGWEEIDVYTDCSIRDDQCAQVSES